ncbi:MAG: hypothetical protein GTO41_09165 [Burkholderiales bacterium]|nr:hypothetical protein [Burkholderiales bacterium]
MSEKNSTNNGSAATLWLILAICVLPIVVSTALFFFWTPIRLVNHGELLEPVRLQDVSLRRSDGDRFVFGELNGRWTFVSIDDAACDDDCLRKLYLMRQIRLTQGKNADRIERLWLVRDGNQPAQQTVAEYEGMRAIVLVERQLLNLFPSGDSRRDYIYLIDPNGNLMMRFPRDVDPSRMKEDIARLLRVSSGWRRIER